jgi:hypothetical protein
MNSGKSITKLGSIGKIGGWVGVVGPGAFFSDLLNYFLGGSARLDRTVLGGALGTLAAIAGLVVGVAASGGVVAMGALVASVAFGVTYFATGLRWDYSYNSSSAYAHASQVPPPRVDPLVIDLNRDGKTEVGGIRFFDLDADGRRELTSWASGGDGVINI